MSADFADFVIEHHPADPAFDQQVRRVMPGFVEVGMGRKVAPILLKLGYRDVTVKIEADTLFTVVGAIDSRRRWNWEMQWQAARPRLVELVDNPKTCTCTSLFITQARK